MAYGCFTLLHLAKPTTLPSSSEGSLVDWLGYEYGNSAASGDIYWSCLIARILRGRGVVGIVLLKKKTVE